MVTLTVPHIETDGAAFKAILDDFLCSMVREYGAAQECSALWFLEFQERGSPHVHILTNYRVPMQWLSQRWACLWEQRVSRLSGVPIVEVRDSMVRASTRVEKLRGSASRYAIKYGSKMEQKDVPTGYKSVGRFWGIRGCRKLHEPEITERELPATALWSSFLVLFWLRLEKMMMIRKISAQNWSYGVGIFVFDSGKGLDFTELYVVIVNMLGTCLQVAATSAGGPAPSMVLEG